jgi:predicted transcriptional regulator of viral defense system
MDLIKLRNIKKSYFGYEELARTLGISTASARVTASRYVKMGALMRIKRNLYVRSESWDTATKEDKFIIASLGETPSYISLMTALDYYGITTQMQRDFFESVAVQRTKTISVRGTVFRYSKISSDLYFGFEKKDGFFIATPEKALLDAVYLISYGRYALDLPSIDPEKINRLEMEKLSRSYPGRTQKLLRTYGYIQAA